MLAVFIMLACSCQHETAFTPLKFKCYEHNPILVRGAPGSFDEMAVLTPYMLNYNDVFYLFYSGWSINGKISVGIASSTDGYHFEKYPGNPIFTPRAEGFDSYHVGVQALFRDDSAWVMYYNASETALFGPAPYIGRAKAKVLTGPWERMDEPVLTRGSMSEWDGGFVVPSSILKREDGIYLMYFTGGRDWPEVNYHIGLATSADGIHWVKYNDPSTTAHPFADSDPVLMATQHRNFIDDYPWSASVNKTSTGFEMYYSANDMEVVTEKLELGYAVSLDGIHWEKYPGNPVYRLTDDPLKANRPDEGVIEFPSLVYTDSVVFLYYDCGITSGSISMATTIPVGGLSRGTK